MRPQEAAKGSQSHAVSTATTACRSSVVPAVKLSNTLKLPAGTPAPRKRAMSERPRKPHPPVINHLRAVHVFVQFRHLISAIRESPVFSPRYPPSMRGRITAMAARPLPWPRISAWFAPDHNVALFRSVLDYTPSHQAGSERLNDELPNAPRQGQLSPAGASESLRGQLHDSNSWGYLRLGR